MVKVAGTSLLALFKGKKEKPRTVSPRFPLSHRSRRLCTGVSRYRDEKAPRRARTVGRWALAEEGVASGAPAAGGGRPEPEWPAYFVSVAFLDRSKSFRQVSCAIKPFGVELVLVHSVRVKDTSNASAERSESFAGCRKAQGGTERRGAFDFIRDAHHSRRGTRPQCHRAPATHAPPRLSPSPPRALLPERER